MDLQAKDWLPAIIGLAGGSLAGLIAAMTAVIGKENKISEFRQAWIDAQRADLASICSQAEAYVAETDIAKKVERLATFDAARARVELRENPRESEWAPIRAEIGSLRDEMIKSLPDKAAMKTHCTAILDGARWPLKANWSIVKTGEPWYRRFKASILVAVVAAVTLGVTVALWIGPTGPYLHPRVPSPDPKAAAASPVKPVTN
ncbi:hypothetical protein [Sphingomonas sp. 22176]|uniref:hypothetical protein n=1 Tax=Sphingomonas sp. 22176 TaxID=3453884 RepID=UPI003F83BAE2